MILQELLESQGERWTEEMKADLPHSFQRHEDLVLLGDNCFSHPLWKKMGTDLNLYSTLIYCWVCRIAH